MDKELLATMSNYEWVAIIFAFLTGLGSLIAWLISQQRITEANEKANIANKIANRALEISEKEHSIIVRPLFKAGTRVILGNEFCPDANYESFRLKNVGNGEARNVRLNTSNPRVILEENSTTSVFRNQEILISLPTENLLGELKSLNADDVLFPFHSFPGQLVYEDYLGNNYYQDITYILNIENENELKLDESVHTGT